MTNVKDISGQAFHFLTALRHVRSKPGGAIWLCRCVCGQEREVPGSALRFGKWKSCGCKTKEILAKLRTVNFHCTVEGCDREAVTHQMCDRHYRRVKRYGANITLSKKSPYTVRERLDKASVRAASGCLEWQRGADKDGYGLLRVDGRMTRAHRVAWIDQHGNLPRNMFVCHSCDNPKCIELSHLFIGTGRDNRLDCLRKGRANVARGAKHWNYKDGSYVKAS